MRLREGEAERLAAALGIAVEEFTGQYADLAEDRRGLVLKCADDGRCCFLTEANLCRVNAVKPRQCAEFPYSWQPTPEQARLCQGHWEE